MTLPPTAPVAEAIPHQTVREFVARTHLPVGGEHLAGTPEWNALPDDDPAKLGAVILSGLQRVLEIEVADLHRQREASKSAAVEVSHALDWRRVAKRIRERDEWLRAHPWGRRVGDAA